MPRFLQAFGTKNVGQAVIALVAAILIGGRVFAVEAVFGAPGCAVDCGVFDREAVEDFVRRKQAEAFDDFRLQAH